MQIVEIDPTKKYAIIFERKLSHEEIERMRANFKDFMERPDHHFLILEGARLVKVDEVQAISDGEEGGGE